MGGRGASWNKSAKDMGTRYQYSNLSMEELEKKHDQAIQRVTDWYNEHSDVMSFRVPDTEGIRAKYYKLLSASNDYDAEIRRRIKIFIEEQRAAEAVRDHQRAPNKTFVNGFGEATTKYITTSTYDRAQKRLHKRILSNLGVG